MANADKRVDAYIEKAEPFARPILEHLRKLVHQGNPEVQETIKWGMPSFDYKGPYCNMAAFKQHVVFGFWKDKLLKDPKNYLEARSNQGGDAMGNMGKLTSLKDLPPDNVIIDFVRQAKKLNDDGIKLPSREPKTKKPLEMPDYFAEALEANKKAKKVFEEFSPSAKKEYVEWLTEAKTDTTRQKRLQTAIEWISEGKRRNWKYETKSKK